MTNPTTDRTTTSRDDALPPAVQAFLDAHAVRDVDAALAALAPDAVVTDQGDTFRGTEELRRFVRESGAEFTYTSEVLSTEQVDAEQVDAARWLVTVRIVGDFPGGTADLGYRFILRDGLVAELRIG